MCEIRVILTLHMISPKSFHDESEQLCLTKAERKVPFVWAFVPLWKLFNDHHYQNLHSFAVTNFSNACVEKNCNEWCITTEEQRMSEVVQVGGGLHHNLMV